MMQHLNVKYIGDKVKLTSTRAPYDYNTRRRFGRRRFGRRRFGGRRGRRGVGRIRIGFRR